MKNFATRNFHVTTDHYPILFSFFSGVPLRSVERIAHQDRTSELTPKLRQGRSAIECPEWVLLDIRLIIMGMYGFKGGPKQGRKYPTVASVREAFYELHDEAVKDADQSAGEVPLVGKTTFRYIHYSRSKYPLFKFTKLKFMIMFSKWRHYLQLFDCPFYHAYFRQWMIKAGFTFGTIQGRSVAVAREAASLDLIEYLLEIQK